MARKAKSKSKSKSAAADSDVEALRAAIASLSAQTLASSGVRYLGEDGLEKLIGLVRAGLRDGLLVLEIRTAPQDARVVMNGIVRNTLPVRYGAEVSWEAGADGYNTKSGSLTVTEDTSLEVDLAQETRSLTINATPSSSRITVTTADGMTYTGSGTLTVDVPYGMTAEWKVSGDGPSKRGSVVMTEDTVIDVEIVYEDLYLDWGSGRIPAAAGTYDLVDCGVVSTNAEYITVEVTDGSDWMTVVNRGSGNSDAVTVTANTSGDYRYAEIKVEGESFDGMMMSMEGSVPQEG